ncbi:MAG: hypothetical protein V1814_02195 [Candidatus Moraniibacteriota bacterium]
MKQEKLAKKIFSISIIIFALLFSAGKFFDLSSADAASKSSGNKNYVEHEVVAKIAPDADAASLAEKYGLSAELLKTSSGGNLYILKSGKRLSTKTLIKKI